MGIFSKTLPELVEKALAKKEKIEQQIANLEEQIQKVNSNIQEQTHHLVNFELEEDTANQDKCKKEIRKLKIQENEMQDRVNAYKGMLEKGCLSEQEQEEIKKVANKEGEERYRQQSAHRQEKKKLEMEKEERIAEIDKKIAEIDSEIAELERQSSRNRDSLVRSILPMIEPNYKKIRWGDTEGYINKWLNDHDTSQHFKQDEVQQTQPEGYIRVAGEAELEQIRKRNF